MDVQGRDRARVRGGRGLLIAVGLVACLAGGGAAARARGRRPDGAGPRRQPVGLARRRQDDPARRRLRRRPRQPQPVRRLHRTGVRGVLAELRVPGGAPPGGLHARPGRHRGELGAVGGRQHLDVPPARGHHVAGRAAADGRRRGLHLQLHHRERHAGVHQRDQGHRQGRQGGRLHRPARHLQAQVQHPAPLDPDPAQARLGEDPAQAGGQRRSRTPTPSAAARSRSSSGSAARTCA